METPKIPQQLSSIISGQPNLKASLTTDNSSQAEAGPLAEVALSEEEERLLLQRARQEKAHRLAQAARDRAYFDRINAGSTLTADELGAWIIAETKRYDEQNQNPRYVGPKGFVLDQYSEPIFEALCQYFTNDPLFEDAPNRHALFKGKTFSLTKGVALFGGPGVGKSKLMKMFCDNPRQPYLWTPCTVAAESYESQATTADGNIVFDRFCQKSDVYRSRYRTGLGGRAFDDLGVETIPSVLFNKKRNLMLDIMIKRYDAGPDTVGLTHMTSNLTVAQIEEIYGIRLRSRFREMYNMIVFDPKAPDRRG